MTDLSRSFWKQTEGRKHKIVRDTGSSLLVWNLSFIFRMPSAGSPLSPDCPFETKRAALSEGLRECWKHREHLQWSWGRDKCAWYRSTDTHTQLDEHADTDTDPDADTDTDPDTDSRRRHRHRPRHRRRPRRRHRHRPRPRHRHRRRRRQQQTH